MTLPELAAGCVNAISKGYEMISNSVRIEAHPMKEDCLLIGIKIDGELVNSIFMAKKPNGLYNSVVYKSHRKDGMSDTECKDSLRGIVTKLMKAMQAHTNVKLFEDEVLVSGVLYDKGTEL